MRSRALHATAFVLFSFSLLAGPQATLAAKGTDITPSLTVLTGVISPGEDGAFVASFENTGSSTFTDLYFSAHLVGGSFAGAYLPAGCTIGGGGASVACSLGMVASGAPRIDLLFVVTAAGTPGTLSIAAEFAGDSRQNNQQAAKRDTWPLSGSASIEGSVETFGRWQQPHGAAVGFPSVGSAGFQQTTVTAAPTAQAYLVLVDQRNEPVACGDGTVIAGFGLAIDVSVNQGGTPVTVETRYGADALANTPTNKIDLVHEVDGRCDHLHPGCPTTGSIPAVGCFDVRVEGKGKNQITIVTARLPGNGVIKGW